MYKIEQLRKAFSKASVFVSDGKCSIVYATASGQMIIQEIHDEDLEFFIGFVASCDKMVMKESGKSHFSVTFWNGLESDTVVFLNPLEFQMDLDGFIDTLGLVPDPDLAGDFIEFSFKSKFSYIEGAEEYVTSVMDKVVGRKTSEEIEKQDEEWAVFESKIKGMLNIVHGFSGIDFSPPDEYSGGFVEMSIKKNTEVVFNNEEISQFVDILRLSSNISFEVEASDGETLVTIYQ